MLDEPTAGLDPLVQEEVEALLREVVADGRTVFFSSHVLAEVEEVASSVAMLRSGRIVAVADLAEQRRLAPRRVVVTFDETVAEESFAAIEGVRLVAIEGREAVFESDDHMDGFVKALARHRVRSLETHELTLEELFRSYYEDSAERGDGPDG